MRILITAIKFWLGYLIWGWLSYTFNGNFNVSVIGCVFVGTLTLINYIEDRIK